MPLPSGHAVTAVEFASINNHKSINVVSASNDTYGAGTYQALVATSSLTFTKYLTTTALRIDLSATFVPSATLTGAKFGVQVNSINYDMCQSDPNVTTRHQVSGTRSDVATGLAAGNWVVQVVWLRFTGAGNLQRFATDDWLSMTVSEVNPS